MKLLLIATTMFFVQTIVLPDFDLLTWMIVSISVSFTTEGIKVLVKGTSTAMGVKKALIRLSQYGGAIAVGMVIRGIASFNGIEQANVFLSYFNNWLITLIVCIECTTTLKNLYEVDKTSLFSKYFIKPMVNLFTFQIKNNPTTQHEKSTD